MVLEQKIETYADHLKSIGEAVVEIDGIPWMKYNNALVSVTTMPVYVEITNEKAIEALKKRGHCFCVTIHAQILALIIGGK